MTLDELSLGVNAHIICLQATPYPTVTTADGRNQTVSRDAFDAHTSHDAEIILRLEDIGFTPGEVVAVLKRGALGGDPMVVRIGHSRFALRRAEARCVGITKITTLVNGPQ